MEEQEEEEEEEAKQTRRDETRENQTWRETNTEREKRARLAEISFVTIFGRCSRACRRIGDLAKFSKSDRKGNIVKKEKNDTSRRNMYPEQLRPSEGEAFVFQETRSNTEWSFFEVVWPIIRLTQSRTDFVR